MSILPYPAAAVSAWAVIATVVAIVHRKNLHRERREHANAQEMIARYRSALSQLNAKATDIAREFEALQRKYLDLKQSTEAQTSTEQPIPMIMVDGLDISAEIGTIFEHVARVARAIRHYSAFSRGHQAPESGKARYDLHWLSDCLHSFDQIGKALARGSSTALTAACKELLTMYNAYPKDSSGYNSRDTFQRLAVDVPLDGVTDAIRSITLKAAPSQDGPVGSPIGSIAEVERIM
ncbi:MAG: hypothetical protein QM581_07590 [Pseudomonas sp.]